MPAPVVDRFAYEKTILQVAGIVDMMGMTALLRRGLQPNVLDRPCRIFVRRYTSREMMGGLTDPVERMVIMSAKNLPVPPQLGVDSIITLVQPITDPQVEDENLRIIEVPTPIKPAGIVVAYKIRVRR